VWKKRFGEDVLLPGAKIASELVHGGQRNSRSVDAPFWFISAQHGRRTQKTPREQPPAEVGERVPRTEPRESPKSISAPWRPGIRQSTLTERLEFAELLHVDRDGFAAAVDEVFRDDAWREFR
jgi:hypothetical protein